MGDIYDQFELELANLGRKYAAHPRRQMIRLFLLALEREEIVSVGYREELIAARLDTHAHLGAGARDCSSRLALDLEGRRDARDLHSWCNL